MIFPHDVYYNTQSRYTGCVFIFTIAMALGMWLPDVTGDPNAMGMTHYMGLLSSNQPWNVFIFMGVPVVLAEMIAVTELEILYMQGNVARWVSLMNRYAGLAIGPWFTAIAVYLLKNAVLPLTLAGLWHGAVDVIAVMSYVSCVIPLVGITLIEMRMLAFEDERARMRMHATFVGILLVVVHVAMIFGMLDPKQWGWSETA